jgi:hypothetical protein
MSVKLREKPLSNGRSSLYLDYYPPITNPQTSKQSGTNFLICIFLQSRNPKQNIDTTKKLAWLLFIDSCKCQLLTLQEDELVVLMLEILLILK